MLHGVLSSLGEQSYRQGLFSLHENSKQNLPVTSLRTNSTRCTSHYKPKGSADREKTVLETCQSWLEAARCCCGLRGLCIPTTAHVSYWDFQIYQRRLIWSRDQLSHQNVAGDLLQDGASRCSPCLSPFAVMEVIYP